MSTAQTARWVCARLPVAPAARLAAYQGMTRLLAPSAAAAREQLERRRLFLVTSTGRTGTTWLATLLDTIPGCRVAHEPIPSEQVAHVAALVAPDSADAYVRDFRIRDAAWRLKGDDNTVYGEVNGALRRHVGALRELFPQLRVLQIVRHPRNVIASMLQRGALTDDDRVYRRLTCPDGIAADVWQAMDRFERLCWLWSADNAYMRAHADAQVVFEEITRDYQSLRAQVLEPLDLELDEQVFNAHRNLGRNASRRSQARTDSWSDAHEAAFQRHCGAEMVHYECYANQA